METNTPFLLPSPQVWWRLHAVTSVGRLSDQSLATHSRALQEDGLNTLGSLDSTHSGESSPSMKIGFVVMHTELLLVS